jgi:predicted RNase H-like nuclease (RuvC/YqgF family)
MEAIVSGEIEKRLSTQVDHLYNTIERMRRERDEALALAQTAQEYRDKSIQMESELKLTKQRAEELDRQLKEAQKRVEELSREVGEAYVKGVMEALERKGDLPRRDQQNHNP